MEKLPETRSANASKTSLEPANAGVPARKPNGQFQPGNSGNPKGRAPGSLNRSSLLVRELLEASAEDITKAAIAEAKAGNALAIKLCLDRLAPQPQSRTVQLGLPAPKLGRNRATADLLADHTAVLRAVAEGDLTPQEGESLSNIVEARRRSWESVELADRLSALEDRTAESATSQPPPTVRWIEPSEHGSEEDSDK